MLFKLQALFILIIFCLFINITFQNRCFNLKHYDTQILAIQIQKI